MKPQFRYQAVSYDGTLYRAFRTRSEAKEFLGGNEGEIRKWRVREPERTIGEGKWGELCRLWGREDGGRQLQDRDLPIGKYFYHNTPIEKLTNVRQQGLTSSLEEKWRLEQYGEPIPAGPERRLYMWALGDDCLTYLHTHFDFEKRIEIPEQVPMRFRRNLLIGRPLYFDGRYDGSIFSLYAIDTTIPVEAIECCTRWWKRWDDEDRRHFAGKWKPLEQGVESVPK